MNWDIKRKLRALAHIKSPLEERERFRHILLSRIQASTAVRTRVVLPRLRLAPLFAAFLALCVIFGTGGITFAAQNALPGELLYPVKIATEKAHLAIVRDEVKKTALRVDFASKRLTEVDQLIESSGAENDNIDATLAEYSKTLTENETALEDNKDRAVDIAGAIDAEAETQQHAIEKLSAKLEKRHEAKELRDHLEKVHDDVEEKGDNALLVIVSATSTEPTHLSENIIRKSRVKVERKEQNVREAAHIVEEARTQGQDVREADAKLKDAGVNIERAKSRLKDGDIRESLKESIEARKKTREARDLVKRGETNQEGGDYNQKQGGRNKENRD